VRVGFGAGDAVLVASSAGGDAGGVEAIEQCLSNMSVSE